MSPDKHLPEQPLIAYELYPDAPFGLEAAPIAREWMDQAHQRFPYRCLPLAIANQCGWLMRSPATFRAYWYGGPTKEEVEVQSAGSPDTRILSHFGVGTITGAGGALLLLLSLTLVAVAFLPFASALALRMAED